jgi:hypothetical protein
MVPMPGTTKLHCLEESLGAPNVELTADDTPSSLVVRPAASADLPRLGRLGALLVDAHHDFDA